MDKPLTVWYCDVCNKPVDLKKGYVVWKSDLPSLKDHSFRIIHQKDCDIDRRNYSSSAALEDFVGIDGLAYVTTFLSLGPIKTKLNQGNFTKAKDMDELADFIRRVQLPYYEEARRHFNNPDLIEHYSDNNEYGPYTQESLKRIIERFG